MKRIYAVSIVIVLIAASFAIGFEMNSFKPKVTENNTVTVVDDYNTVVKVPQPVNRIVSLAPSDTEILFALGLGNKVVGDTVYDDYPAAAANITHIGGVTNSSVEEIVALKPNLVLGYSNFEPNVVESLRNLNIPVIVLNPPTITWVMHDISIVGLATNTTPRANYLDSMFTNITNDIQNDSYNITNPIKVLFLAWYNPIYTSGQGTFINDMINMVGAINVAGNVSQQWFEMSEESAIASNPSVILLASSNSFIVSEIKNDSIWNVVNAVKNNSFVIMNDVYILEAGPQIFIGLEILAKALYPSVYANLPVLTYSDIFPSNS
ncbi:MAG: ABC transporter substrate-binding protein [Thermoplasmata archaeon]